jgi:hypothetical protein
VMVISSFSMVNFCRFEGKSVVGNQSYNSAKRHFGQRKYVFYVLLLNVL